jgi:excisionase family DNA binding protein
MEIYLTTEELADYLKLAEQTIRRWVLNREIPYHKIKKVIRFRVSEIETWINDGSYSSPKEHGSNKEVDLFRDVISLDELAEMEQAEERHEEIEV